MARGYVRGIGGCSMYVWYGMDKLMASWQYRRGSTREMVYSSEFFEIYTLIAPRSTVQIQDRVAQLAAQRFAC